MTEQTFKPGDVVQLLSTPADGPAMTVVYVRGEEEERRADGEKAGEWLPPIVVCTWQDNTGKVGEEAFPPEALRLRGQL